MVHGYRTCRSRSPGPSGTEQGPVGAAPHHTPGRDTNNSQVGVVVVIYRQALALCTGTREVFECILQLQLVSVKCIFLSG